MNVCFVFIEDSNTSTIWWRSRGVHSFDGGIFDFLLHIRVILGFDILVISRMYFVRLIFVHFLAIILCRRIRCRGIILTKFILTSSNILIGNIRYIVWPTISSSIRSSIFSFLFFLNIMNIQNLLTQHFFLVDRFQSVKGFVWFGITTLQFTKFSEFAVGTLSLNWNSSLLLSLLLGLLFRFWTGYDIASSCHKLIWLSRMRMHESSNDVSLRRLLTKRLNTFDSTSGSSSRIGLQINLEIIRGACN